MQIIFVFFLSLSQSVQANERPKKRTAILEVNGQLAIQLLCWRMAVAIQLLCRRTAMAIHSLPRGHSLTSSANGQLVYNQKFNDNYFNLLK